MLSIFHLSYTLQDLVENRNQQQRSVYIYILCIIEVMLAVV